MMTLLTVLLVNHLMVLSLDSSALLTLEKVIFVTTHALTFVIVVIYYLTETKIF